MAMDSACLVLNRWFELLARRTPMHYSVEATCSLWMRAIDGSFAFCSFTSSFSADCSRELIAPFSLTASSGAGVFSFEICLDSTSVSSADLSGLSSVASSLSCFWLTGEASFSTEASFSKLSFTISLLASAEVSLVSAVFSSVSTVFSVFSEFCFDFCSSSLFWTSPLTAFAWRIHVNILKKEIINFNFLLKIQSNHNF